MEPGGADAADAEIFDGLAALITGLMTQAEQIARGLGVPTFFLKALHLLEGPMAMKDLGRRMHCDPSFVTSVADLLEKHGLARREPDPADRRVRRIALTADGLDFKRRVEAEVLSRMPWRHALDADERACLLGLIRKMLPAADSGKPGGFPAPGPREEVNADPAPPVGAGA